MNNKNGFTLVEILAVIAIIGVLIIISLPSLMEIFKDASNNSMTIQENEIVDASKLFLEDYCIHPLGDNICSDYSKDVSEPNLKYVCLSTLQDKGYMDPVAVGNGTSCSGFVVYNKEADSKQYSNHKAYIECGSAYQTQDYSKFKDTDNKRIIENCGGN